MRGCEIVEHGEICPPALRPSLATDNSLSDRRQQWIDEGGTESTGIHPPTLPSCLAVDTSLSDLGQQ